MKSVEPAPHEFAANYLYSEHGLGPFFAADSRIKAGGGSQAGGFEHDGERWVVRLYYQDSGIVHPGQTTPQGTEWRLDEMREFRLSVARHPDEDSVGQQSFNAHMAPRWPGMEAETDDGQRIDIEVPEGFGEGVNVRIQGSNIAFQRYKTLLRKAAESVGINGYYFKTPHEYSNVVDAEKYVRVNKDRSGPVHARDGPIASMGHLLENDRRGYRKVVQNDDDLHGRNLPGYYHTVTLGQRRVREAFPDHDVPREVKHYYAKEAKSLPDEHPLAHPKVGSSYQRNRWDESLGVDELDELERQLDQTVLSVLADAGLQIHAGENDPFREDAYFQPENVERPDDYLYGLDLTHIRQEQESVVVRHLVDGGLSPVQEEALDVLVTDGGEIAPKDIAEREGRHVGSVRRALRQMEDLVDREYGRVSLRSPFVAELVHDAVTEAREAFDRAASTSAKAIEAAERGLDETTSAFIAWAARHDLDVEDAREARLMLRMGDVENVGKAIREGYRLWVDGGRDPARYRQAKIDRGDGFSTAWYYLTG